MWTGGGAALVGAVSAIAAVALLWLPASGGSGNAASAIRAGVLTFLAALHGGVTVDGLPADFVPLGMTIAVAAIGWRAGSGLADAAEQLGEQRAAVLVRAGVLQAVTFAAACGFAARFATLGSSQVSPFAATVAGLLLFGVSGAVAFARASALREVAAGWLPQWIGPALRAAAAALAVYLAAGALLLGAALVLHHQRVEALSREVGGGWSGVPILLLGALAAPNAAVAGAAYLAGPGFALGSGSAVSLGSTVHGTLPAFPLLGAVPTGPADVATWLLAGLTPFVAGACAARVAAAGVSGDLRSSLRTAGVAALFVAVAGFVLAWQAGGSIGSGRLSAFGASPWKFGLTTAGAVGAVAIGALAALAALEWWRAGRATKDERRPVLTAVHAGVDEPDSDDGTEAGVLAG
jgi:hypothetical protein